MKQIPCKGGIVQFENSFLIPELADSEYGITSLSVNNNKILAGSYAIRKEDAYIYCGNTNGDRLSTFKLACGVICG